MFLFGSHDSFNSHNIKDIDIFPRILCFSSYYKILIKNISLLPVKTYLIDTIFI